MINCALLSPRFPPTTTTTIYNIGLQPSIEITCSSKETTFLSLPFLPLVTNPLLSLIAGKRFLISRRISNQVFNRFNLIQIFIHPQKLYKIRISFGGEERCFSKRKKREKDDFLRKERISNEVSIVSTFSKNCTKFKFFFSGGGERKRNKKKREKDDFLRKERILNKVSIVSIFPKSLSIPKNYTKFKFLPKRKVEEERWREKKRKDNFLRKERILNKILIVSTFSKSSSIPKNYTKFEFFFLEMEKGGRRRWREKKRKGRFFKERENFEQSFNRFNLLQIFIHPQKLYKIRILFFWRCRKVEEDVECAKKKKEWFFKEKENLEQSFQSFQPSPNLHPSPKIVQNSNSFLSEVKNVAFLKGKKRKKREKTIF